MACNKYPIIQNNGQRIYFPAMSDKTVPTPPRGSEVFVGNLPRDIFEDELIPLFSKAGPIYKFRLMMDFSGQSRGFAFVHFYNVEHANKAIARFDGLPMERMEKNGNIKISVTISLDNCKLFFGNIPKEKTSEELAVELRRVVDGMVKVITYSETRNARLNRGFAFVEFESHAMAAIARRRLLSGVVNLWNAEDYSKRVYVDWAEPEPIVKPEVLKQVKILYFKNVPVHWTPDRFKDMVNRLLKNIEIVRMYKKDNYAFVHFQTREGAELALTMLKSASEFLVFYGKTMEAEWARPIHYSKRYTENKMPDNLCMSVPPRIRKIVQQSKNRRGASGSSSHHGGPRMRSSSDNSDLFTEIDIATAEDFLSSQFGNLSLRSNFD